MKQNRRKNNTELKEEIRLNEMKNILRKLNHLDMVENKRHEKTQNKTPGFS